MSSRAKRGICTSVIALSSVLILGLQSCKQATKPPVGGVPTAADSADQIIFDGHTVLTDGGVKRGDMYADTIFVFDDQTRFSLRRVRAEFNTETGAKNGTLKGDRGTYNLRTRILEGFGNVVVTSTDGKELRSNHLKFVESANLISSDSAFTATQGDKVSTGIGFTSDPNLRSIKCFRACGGSGLVPIGEMKRP